MWLEEIRDPKWHGTPAERAAEAYRELSSRAPADRWRGLTGGEDIREFVDRIRLGAEKFLQERGRPPDRGRAAGVAHRRARPRASPSSPTPAPTRSSSATCSGSRRRRGSGSAWCCATRRSAGSRRSRSATATRSASPRSPTSSTSRPPTAPQLTPGRLSRSGGWSGSATPIADLVKQFQFLVFTKLEGAVTAGMIHLGDRLGLYRALADADGPLTSAELADGDRARRAVGAGVGVQPGGGASSSDRRRRRRRRAVLADAGGGRRAGVAGPRGVRHGHVPPPAPDDGDARASCRRASAPGSATTTTATARRAPSASSAASSRGTGPTCCPTCCPRSTASATSSPPVRRVADIGCGAGGAVLLMAAAFPASRFTGYDISQLRPATGPTSGCGEAGADERRVPRSARATRCPTDHSLDLVTTFDCIHDMTDPQGMMAAIRRRRRRRRHVAARRHQGAATRSPRTSRKNPMASLMYGISVLSCMSSALSRARRRRPRHARPAGVEGRGDGPRGRLHAVPQAPASTTPSTRSTRSGRDAPVGRCAPPGAGCRPRARTDTVLPSR